VIDNALNIQLRHEVMATAKHRGYPLVPDKIKIWLDCEMDEIHVTYQLLNGRSDRMKIPKSRLGDRSEVFDQHFPAVWSDPVC
jgi:hypothetical protein